MYGVKIAGTGSYLPEKIVTNLDFEKVIDTNDEWIRTRTGIIERRFVSEEQTTSDLAYEAAKKAIENANIDKNDVDLVVMCTFTPDYHFPATGCIVVDKLGINGTPAFDVEAACSGFVYGLAVGSQFIRTGMYKNVLVIGADANSRILDFQDRNTCILFGDGGGAVLLQPIKDDNSENKGVREFYMGSDGSGGKHLDMPAGGAKCPASHETVDNREHYLKMNGKEIFKFAVVKIPESINGVIANTDVKLEDLDHVVLHQANIRIMQHAAKKMGIPMEKMFVNLDKYGNTSAGTIPIALDEMNRSGKIKKGDNIVVLGFGGGLTWAASLITWE